MLNCEQDRVRGLFTSHVNCNSPLRQVRPRIGVGGECGLSSDERLNYTILCITGLRLLRKIGLCEVANLQKFVGTSIILVLYIFVVLLRNIRGSRYLLEGGVEEAVKGPAT